MKRALLGLVAGGCLAFADESAPTWTPDKTVATLLSAEVETASFRIRPPKGYALTEQPVTATTKAFAWRGAKRANGRSPFLLVVLTPVPAKEASAPTPEDLLKKYLTSLQNQRENWKPSEAERGQINGLTFLRAHWDGTERTTKYRMHGFIYVAVHGRDIIYLSSQDTDPEHVQSLRLTEAAALTLQWR